MNARVISRNAVIWLAGLIGLAAAHYVRAQEPVVDPPGRVARLSLMDGEVSLAPAGTEEWADGVLNRPITSGDRVWVGADGRAELQVGTASVHLDRSTGFEFIELDDDVMQMSLTEGVATVRVRTLGERENIQVETPNATVHFRHPGDYTVQVDPETDRTIVRTRNGEAEVTGANKSFRVRAERGRRVHRPRRPDGQHRQRSRRAPHSNRGRTIATAAATRPSRRVTFRAKSSVTKISTTKATGSTSPNTATCGGPRYVVHDWAPYRYGRWGWVAPWGWTWIDDARWGFAPFHYGRWAFVRHRWCWVPGPRHIRPYYAPALVGWVGGPSVNVSLSFGHGVGWFPLAPREVYVPWYRHTPRYVRHVNVSNTIIVNNINVTNVYGRRGERPRHTYANDNWANSVTTVGRDVFVRGGRVGSQRVHVSDRDLRQWRDDVRPSSIAPERQSILAGQPRREAPPPAAFDTGKSEARQRRRFPRQRAWLRSRSSVRRRASATLRRKTGSLCASPKNACRACAVNRRGRTKCARNSVHARRCRRCKAAPSENRSNQSGDNSIRRSRENFEQRDTFRRGDTRREVPEPPQMREERQLRERPSESRREVREAPVERRSAPQIERRSAPQVEQRSAPQVEQRSAPRVEQRSEPRVEQRSEPRVERSEPRVERQHSDRGNSSNSNQGSSRRDNGGEGPRERPNRRSD